MSPITQPDPALLIEGVSVCHDGREILQALDLRLPRGATLALVGPNGGGKTTLLRAILGLVAFTGTITVDGLAPGVARRRGGVLGYVPQRLHVPAALPMSGREAVRIAAVGRTGLFQRPDPASDDYADQLLTELGGPEGEELAATAVTKMSGGQLQKVFLARALVSRPALLLLDEPTVGLDAPSVGRLVSLLNHLRTDSGLSTLIATHDHLTAMAVADEMAYVDRTFRYQGPADQLPPDLDSRLCHHNHAAMSS